MKVYVCDRCGEFYTDQHESINEATNKLRLSTLPRSVPYDLCPKCQDFLQAWFMNDKEEKNA